MQLFPVSHRCHQDLSGNKPRSDTLDAFWGSYLHTTLSVRTAVTFGFLQYMYIPKAECLFQPGFEQISKHIITAAWENFPFSFFSTFPQIPSISSYFLRLDCCTTLWCQSSKASEVKHLKPTGNIKEPGSCRQLGAPVLQDFSLQPNTSGTSCFLGAMSVRPQGWQREGPWIFSQWLEELMPWNKWLTLFQMTDPLLS